MQDNRDPSKAPTVKAAVAPGVDTVNPIEQTPRKQHLKRRFFRPLIEIIIDPESEGTNIILPRSYPATEEAKTYTVQEFVRAFDAQYDGIFVPYPVFKTGWSPYPLDNPLPRHIKIGPERRFRLVVLGRIITRGL
jgi:hypothetical protein